MNYKLIKFKGNLENTQRAINIAIPNCRLRQVKEKLIVKRLKQIAFLNIKTSFQDFCFRPFFHLFLIALITVNLACGKRRPPLPPSNSRLSNLTDFTAAQQGNRIVLTIPLKRNDGNSRPRQIDVFRLAESTGSPLFLTEDEFAARSTQVGSVQLTDSNSVEVIFYDVLTPTSQSRRLRYAVRFVNSDNQKSPFSNFIFFEPISNAAKPPILSVPNITQTAINLLWQAPLENIDGSAPVNVLGYNVYRKSMNGEKLQQLNNSPLLKIAFEDKNFKFGESYEYFVRTISAGSNGTQIESVNSNSVAIQPKDIFPPAAPENLTIAAAPGNLSVFFAASVEPDVIGYNIFRSTKMDLPLDQWQKLNGVPFSATSFQDTKIEAGQKYFYYAIALDSAGNVSNPSEIVSETAP